MRNKAGNADAISRKDFLRGGLASLGFLALPGGLFAAPSDWKPKKKPNLTFGVVSDTHMRCHYDGERFYSHGNAYYDVRAARSPQGANRSLQPSTSQREVQELRKAQELAEENLETIRSKWHEYFD